LFEQYKQDQKRKSGNVGTKEPKEANNKLQNELALLKLQSNFLDYCNLTSSVEELNMENKTLVEDSKLQNSLVSFFKLICGINATRIDENKYEVECINVKNLQKGNIDCNIF
jgi:hypothetical protein